MFEEAIARMIANQNAEKTSTDKVLAKQDIEEIRKIIRKENLTREDMLELQYMMASSESKLYNLSEYHRYILMKYYAIIGDFAKNIELFYDYRERLVKERKDQTLPDETKKLIENVQGLASHNIKFLVDFYLNIARTSISIGGTGFLEILKNKWELVYGDEKTASNVEKPKKKWWGLGG